MNHEWNRQHPKRMPTLVPEELSTVERLREAVRAAVDVCPTCHHKRGSYRTLGEQTGVSFNVLARFARGMQVKSDTIEALERWAAESKGDGK